MKQVEWRYSNQQESWAAKQPSPYSGDHFDLTSNGLEYQRMLGFGGCFNEIGYAALLNSGESVRSAILDELFLPGDSRCNFNICRLPIGASDYAHGWYSLDDVPGDLSLSNFSIERDKELLIPYIREAQRRAPGMKLFASPWSPPAWMKLPPVYNGGRFNFKPEFRKCYAEYFVRFLREYAGEGIKIDQIHVQNEPVAKQKFPSCLWSGEELRDFIRDDLGPAIQKSGIDTEIWLGTLNAPGCDYNRMIFDKWAAEDYDYFANTVLTDEGALQYITGVSYQWGGKIAMQRTFQSWWPRLRLMQSESECGFGDNTWDYALYIWTMLKHYIENGAESYLYWNMLLPPGGASAWGDFQNAMITIDADKKRACFNPDFYVMKHFSSCLKRGALRLGITGRFSGDSLMFRNPDGGVVLELYNPFTGIHSVSVLAEGEKYLFELEPRSVNSVVIT